MHPGSAELRYRDDVLRELERHGVRPTPTTAPALVRGFVRELYKFEIRRLRERMLRGDFPRREYAARVEALRAAYPVLALLPAQFLAEPPRGDASPSMDDTGQLSG
ncbi:MAG: hypothetical protein AB7Q29_08670 [Vicinamibacterales bacterium]